MTTLLTRLAAASFLISLVAACTATTTLHASQPDTLLAVRDKEFKTLPATQTFPTTSFGNYEFRAERAGHDPFYGILPLKFNGGYLALDILLFAPAAFFNLREVFPQYELDVPARVVRYREVADAPWLDYRPTPAEVERAKKYFETKATEAKAETKN
ncbi:MAG TPA: hypothetical protein VFR86_07945 [Burkholderiaceae bacterium]|nr:hypothetical protein [Burkholderiaceae bacterium]